MAQYRYFHEGQLKVDPTTGTKCRTGQLNHQFVEQKFVGGVWIGIGDNDGIRYGDVAGAGCRFREGMRDGDYAVDVETEIAGFLLTEGDGWVNCGSVSGYWTHLLSDSNVLARYVFNDPNNIFTVNDAGTVISAMELANTISNSLTLGVNKITNPSFINDTAGWYFDGNHAGARITADFAIAPGCLQVTSSGAGSVGVNRFRFPVMYELKTYKVSFYAKSVSGNNLLKVTDSGEIYTKAITITSEWVLYEYYFYKSSAVGAALVMYLGGAGVMLFDDIIIQETTYNGINLVQNNTNLRPPLEDDFIHSNGTFQEIVSSDFANTPLTCYIVGKKHLSSPGLFIEEDSEVQVFNRINEFGALGTNLIIGSGVGSNGNHYYKESKIKEILVRKTDDSYITKRGIDRYYQSIYGGDLPEITNRDILVNKLLPYCSADNFIFCTGNDIHHAGQSLLPMLIDVIKSDISLTNNIKFISAHGDIAAQTVLKTAIQFMAYINFSLIPNLSKGIPIYLGMGNHDSGVLSLDGTDSVVEKVLTNQQQQDVYIAPVVAIDPTIVTDAANSTGRYYYKDFADKKLRFIYLNQFDTLDTSTGANYDYRRDAVVFSEAQLTWLCDYALKLPDSDYHVVLVVHDPAIVGDLNVRALLTAFKTNGSFNITINAYGRTFNLVKDFNTINGFNGVLVAVFMGHNHVPLIQSIANILWITNIGGWITPMTGWDRSIGSVSEYASDFVVINKTNRNIKMLRYGAMRAIAGDPNDHGDRGFANNAYDTIMNY